MILKKLRTANKKLAQFLNKYGLVLAIFFMILAIPFIWIYFRSKWIEATGVLVALVSLFVMIVIMFMNNKTIEDNTQRQMDKFEEQIQKQVDSFSKEVDKQIESFRQNTADIISALEKIAKIQEVTSEKQISSINKGLDNVSTKVEKVERSTKENKPFHKSLIEGVEDFIVNAADDLTNIASNLWSKIKKL